MATSKVKVAKVEFLAFDGKWLTNGRWAYQVGALDAPKITRNDAQTLIDSGVKFLGSREGGQLDASSDIKLPSVKAAMPKKIGEPIEQTKVLVELADILVRVWTKPVDPKFRIFIDMRFDAIMAMGDPRATAHDSAVSVRVEGETVALVMPVVDNGISSRGININAALDKLAR